MKRSSSGFVLFSFILWSLLLQGCSSIDDFFTGTDNAIPPTPLEKINEVVGVATEWDQNTGEGTDEAFVKFYPAIIGAKIIVVDRNGKLTAFDRYSGATLWQKDLEMVVTGGIGSSPDMIFIGNEEAELVAINPENGEIVWRKTLSSISLSKPVGSMRVVIARTLDGKLYGLLKESGEQLWVYDRGVPVLTYRGNSSSVIGGDELVFTGFDSGKVAALGLENGRLLWEAAAAVPRGRSDIERMVDIDGDPILVGRTLFVVTINGRLVALDAITGKLHWTRDISSFAGMGADERNLYVTDHESNIWAFGQQSGEILWKQDKLAYRHLTAPATTDEHVVVSDFEGYLHVLSPTDGVLTGRKQFDKKGFLVPPVVVDGDLFLYGNSGALSAVKLSSNR